MHGLNHNCIVLVTSCGKYKDVLKNFEYFFMKHWRDCPFEVWLSIDEMVDTDFHYDRVIESNHPQNLVRMRDIEFTTPWVIMMQDDHWLIEDVNTDRIIECIRLAEKYKCGNLRLLRDPKTEDVFSEKEELYIYKPGKAYRISARGGLWRTTYLKRFINTFDDFWMMERYGQDYSNRLKYRVLATKHRVLPIIDAVHKGKYEEFALFLLDANRIEAEREGETQRNKMIDCLKGLILEINPELITYLQARLSIGYKPKY